MLFVYYKLVATWRYSVSNSVQPIVYDNYMCFTYNLGIETTLAYIIYADEERDKEYSVIKLV